MTLCVLTFTGFAQDAGKGAWLDKQVSNWNKPGAVLPRAPKGSGGLASNPRCRQTTRRSENLQDRLAIAAGWTLFGSVQSYSGTVVIQAMSDVDGMCRPLGYQTFVFVNGRFAGTLSPTVMDSRTDGSLTTARLYTASDLSGEFARYKEADPLCCASRQSSVSYRVDITPRGPLVVPLNTETTGGTGSAAGTTEKSVILGTVSYRERIALPSTAILNVQLTDVSRADAPARVIAEQAIEARGPQVPIPFELSYDPARIEQRSTYAVSARITVGSDIWFVSKDRYAVLTQGSPSNVNLMLQSARAR